MKQYFPFTNYDFYGYLSCGLLLLFVVDYWCSGGHYLARDNWTVFQGALVVSLSYIIGQIIATLSSFLLEHVLARMLLRSPLVILLSERQGATRHWLIHLVVNRYYAPLPSSVRAKIFENAEKHTGLSRAELEANIEEIFEPAFHVARTIEDVRKRMDDFRNQYGFNRNMAMSGCIAAGLLFHSACHGNIEAYKWTVLALVLSLGMLLRFLKFYSSFTTEVLRTYAFHKIN